MTDRKDRVHVVNVRIKDDKVIIAFSDYSEMTWHQWVNGGREEIVNAK
jgi:hypothetical protein